jgi:hypothetical protein
MQALLFCSPAVSAADVWSSKSRSPRTQTGDIQSLSQACAAVGSFYYHYDGTPNPSQPQANGRLYKYSSATDAWVSGAASHAGVLASMPESVCVGFAVKPSPIGPGYDTLTTASYSTFLYQFDASPGFPANTQKYNTDTDLWVPVKRIPSVRQGPTAFGTGGAAAATVGNAIYVCGGAPGSVPNTAAIKTEAYYPETDTWTSKKDMPAMKAGFAIGASSSKVFAANGGTSLALYIYDVATDAWANGAPTLSRAAWSVASLESVQV